ncbi:MULTISPECIES: coniferyl aldehyde dehydrogenase [Pacificibacter]|uniref:coniferyl aldehyde dehydrogenase n=1 Tax=Pacificibacter TaxID=1042323 RepID=UPI001C09DCEF|nr:MULTISPECIES: coniferyl aldehyde dehydrogenase [Pacificibacter]MBU2934620.1 coniferyl aldehyde dehydrogenase [Pacificibacter marinus]MDO6616936.1 coniferyl aldehyde dehydrogenase [Pacificibacter sp. 1_MG-2023]
MKTDPALSQLPAQFNTLRTAHRTARTADFETRRAWLDSLEAFLIDFEPQLIASMQADFTHRSREECLSLDLGTSISQVRYQRRHLKWWMRKHYVLPPMTFWPARAYTQAQPRGVVGIMAPWNFPVYLAIAPLAAALAAGNRVMIKPSELSPQTSKVLAEGLAQYFSAEVVQVILGGADVAAAFSALPFDHLLFTGSTAVGRKVAQAAAQNLTPVTLELGGKSPAVVMPSADLDQAARRIIWGTTVNAGQVCVAPDYALVPRDQMDAFVTLAESYLHTFYPKGAASTDYCGVISERHLARMDDLLTEVEARDVKVIQLSEEAIPDGQRKCAPALVIDPPLDCAMMTQEIFGPILPIIPYDTVEQALSFVKTRDHPLALYVFAQDKEDQDLWLERSTSGGVTINDTVIHVAVDSLPFGGVGASGYGAYHGKAGFETFSHMKPVLHQAKWNAMSLTEPPMTGVKKRLMKLARKLM